MEPLTHQKGNVMHLNNPLKNNFQDAIDDLLKEMKTTEKTSPEYQQLNEQLRTLTETRITQKSGQVKLAEAGLVVGGNLAGVLAIIHFEKLNVVTSKALSLIVKPKI